MTRRIARRDLLTQTVAGFGLANIGCLGWPPLHAAAAETVAAPTLKAGVRQLFLDDVHVERMNGLKRTLHQPEKHHGNPILRHDQRPWQQFRCQLYGTVLYDHCDQNFKMWYLAGARLPIDEPVMIDGRQCIPNFQLVGYAESKNGFDFEMPDLGLVDYNGSSKNNICRIARECVEGIAVVHDARDSDPTRRYKALYWEHAPQQGGYSAMSASYSADGKTWRDVPKNPVMPYASDSGQQALYDPVRDKYVAYGRYNVGRKIARSDSADFVNWSTPQLVFQTDAADGPAAQIYGMGVSWYEGLYVGLPWIFHDGTTGKIDVQLTVSRDGIRWNRVANRATFIPNGPEESWDAGIIFTASQPLVVVDDKVFIYYSASLHDHHYRPGPLQKTPQWRQYLETVKTSIGVATLRRDGFVSLEPADNVGTILTKPFMIPDKTRLHVNVDAVEGEARVTLLFDDQPAPTQAAHSTVIRGDRLGHAVEWTNGAQLPPSGTPVRLQFELNRTRLYSYWFS